MSNRSLRPAAHALHARIASQTDVLAIETERMIDGLSAEIDRQFARSIQGIAEKLAGPAGSPSYASRYGSASAVQKLLADALQATRAALFDQFARLAAWRQRATGAVLAKTLPANWLARAAAYRRAKPLREADAPDFSATPSDRWQDLIFPAPTQQSVSRIVMAPARFDGKTWDQRLSKLSSMADDKAAVATQIVQGMSAGEGVDAIRKRIEPLVAGVRSSAQRIARTEARRIAETAQEASWASLGDLLIGVQFRAVLDERTRPEHRQRNGKIIYKDSPQWATRPQLPDEPHCRCSYSPVLAEPEALASDPGLRTEFSRAGSLASPDPATYDDWFATASTSTRQKAVGVARYNAATIATGGAPNYRDFVTERGELLSAQQIAAESESDRYYRQMNVQALMGLRRDQIQQIANRGFILREPTAPQIDPVIPQPPRKPGARTPVVANGLPFVRPERAIASRDVVVMVDVAKLDRELARDAASYVGRGGVGGIAGRYQSFGKWVTNASKFGRKDAAVEMTELGLDDSGRPYIENGRHRFAWLRDQGISQVPVSVVRSSAKAFEKAFGVAAPVEQPAATAPLRFPASTATVAIPKHETKPVARASKAIFNRVLAPSDYASLVGAPANSTVQVSMLGRDEIDLLITGPTVQMNRRLLLRDGRKIIVNEWFGATDIGSGLGTRVFAQQVEQAAAAGVDEIRTLAAAGSYNGYYTWPRLGYNAALPSDVRERLPKYLQSATDLLDLMTTARGRAWWKKNGQAIKVSFDPKPGSRSRQVLDAYVRERLAAGTLTLEAEANAAAERVEEFVLSAEEDAILDAVLDAIGREKEQAVVLPVDAD